MSFLFWMLEDFVKKGNGVKLKRISTDRGYVCVKILIYFF